VSGFGEVAARYDGFIVDLWGVVHDGVKPLPGVIDCLSRLREQNKPVVFLSNAPRRAPAVARTLAGMGIGANFYAGIMSSGEAVHAALRDRTDEFAGLGSAVYHLGPARDRDLFDGLPYRQVNAPKEADFLLNTGPDDRLGEDDMAPYLPVLNAALEARLPMVCANPDLEVMKDGRRIICAGLLARHYADHGGAVIMRGKPDPAIYAPTLALLGTGKSRTLAVGDSLRTDIAGAKAAGIDACWVLSGVDARPAMVQGLAPVAILGGLAW
jgi:HAD superfamily hydrolase (TIGR01459 family)